VSIRSWRLVGGWVINRVVRSEGQISKAKDEAKARTHKTEAEAEAKTWTLEVKACPRWLYITVSNTVIKLRLAVSRLLDLNLFVSIGAISAYIDIYKRVRSMDSIHVGESFTPPKSNLVADRKTRRHNKIAGRMLQFDCLISLLRCHSVTRSLILSLILSLIHHSCSPQPTIRLVSDLSVCQTRTVPFVNCFYVGYYRGCP